MAISGSFKQQCPSCEAMVPIKDTSVVGKKVDCPKCKYRFVVEDPVAKDKKAVAGADQGKKAPGPKSKAPAKAPVLDDEVVEAEAEAEPAAGKKPGSGKSRKGGDDQKDRKPKKTKQDTGGNRKLLIGVGLAGVGVVVLGIAAFMLMGGGTPTKVSGIPPSGGMKGDPADPDAPPKKKDGKKKNTDPEVAVTTPTGAPAGPENTNFLPPESDVVYHCWFKDFLASPFGPMTIEAKGALTDADFQKWMGLSILPIDDILTAENFKENWTFHVVHTTKPITDMRPLMRAMGFDMGRPWAGNKTKHKCYEVSARSAPWILTLAKMPLFVPAHTLNAQPVTAKQQPLLVHVRDAQTLIFAHATPMLKYLEKDGKITPNSFNVKASKQAPAGGLVPPYNDAYLTVKPALRDTLLRVESRNSSEKVLFSVATDMKAASLRGKNPDDVKNGYRARPFWDVVNLLDDKTDRIDFAGSALVMKDASIFAFNNTMLCNVPNVTANLQHDLVDNVAPHVVQFFAKVLAHKVDIVDDSAKTPTAPPDPKAPQPPKDDFKSSRIKVLTQAKFVDFVMDLQLSGQPIEILKNVAHLTAMGLKGEAEIASGQEYRFLLADAGKDLGQKDTLAKGGFPIPQPGHFPPAALPRFGPPSTLRTAKEPSSRISWMSTLLPYMGQELVFARISFDKSWQDGENWVPARTLVPQFLDPSFPVTSRFVSYPGMPLDCAATHYVGISGIGLGSADDMNLVPGKFGVFGYERMMPLKTISELGRGLANTVLMIRVPHDGPAGVTPWIAGGGSTVRAVPEKNSLEPFLSTDAKGDRGTYTLMCDGSVRFIKKGMSDELFKSICTIGGPKPSNWDEFDIESPPLAPPKEPAPVPLKGQPIPPGPGTGDGSGGTSGGSTGGTSAPKPGATGLPTGWEKYTHKEGGFTIAMPAGATESTQSGNKGLYLGYKFTKEAEQKAYVFYAACQPAQPGVFTELDPIKSFEETKEVFDQLGAKVDAGPEKVVSLGKIPGREYVLNVQTQGIKMTVYHRTYVFPDRVYILEIAVPGITPNSAEYAAFFNSFKATAP